MMAVTSYLSGSKVANCSTTLFVEGVYRNQKHSCIFDNCLPD